MTAAAAPSIDLPGVIADIRSGVDQATDLVNAIINGINAVLSELPREAIGGVRDGVADLQRTFNDAINKLRHALEYHGDPQALRAAGSAWATDIGFTVSNFAGFAAENMTRADNYWTGDAADAYKGALLPQRFALNAIKAATDEIDAALNELANAITSFWFTIAGALITLVAGLITAAVVAAGAAAAPLAAAIGAGLITTFGLFMTIQMDGLVDVFNEVTTQSNALERRHLNNSTFPDGGWPPAHATEDLSDGSITDGDDTDWHIK